MPWQITIVQNMYFNLFKVFFLNWAKNAYLLISLFD